MKLKNGIGPARILRPSGFSTIEAMVSSAVGLVMVGTLVTLNSSVLTTLDSHSKGMMRESSIRRVADLFAREVRRADRVVLIPESQGMRILADVDRSGVYPDAAGEDVLYGFSPGAFWRQEGADGAADSLLKGNAADRGRIYFVNGSGDEVPYSAAAASAPLLPTTIRRVGLRFDRDSGASPGVVRRAMPRSVAAEVTLRRRFFVVDVAHAVDNALRAQFDADEFIEDLADELLPPSPQPTTDPSPIATPTSQNTVAPTPTATPAPQCRAKNASCSADSECCSGQCKSNNRCH